MKKTSQPLELGIPLHGLSPIMATLRRHGIDPLDLVDGLGMVPAVALDVRMSTATFTRFWERATRQAGAGIALEALTALSTVTFELAPFTQNNTLIAAFSASETVLDGLQRLERCFSAAFPTFRLELNQLGDTLGIALLMPEGASHPTFAEYALGLVCTSVRLCSATPITPTQTLLAHAPQTLRDRYTSIFKNTITFNAHQYAVMFRGSDGPTPLRTASAQLAQRIEQRMIGSRTQRTHKRSFAETVASVVRLSLANGRPTTERVAAELQISARTLARRLSDNNTTFAEISDAECGKIAKRLLRERRDLSIDDVATSMHYSDARAFSRAFKRWFGRSPKAYREETSDQLKALSLSAHNLPHIKDTLIGRQDALQHLTARLTQHRLLTIRGTAGIGKTRLSIEHGHASLPNYPAGVCFCDLSAATSLETLCLHVAQALGLILSDGNATELVGDTLKLRGRMLVILDNFEHLVEHATTSVQLWLERAPQVHILVTSREPLHLTHEHVFVLSPLETPSSDALQGTLDIDAIRQNHAVQLFVQRARETLHTFTLNTQNAAAIGHLMRNLDGLPLAIELAASRIGMLSPESMGRRLSKRFELLKRRRNPEQARDQRGGHTLRGAIAWSWDLLQPWEQSALAQCSVFRGGFDIDAAEAVLDLSLWPEAPWILDVLEALINKSLIRAITPDQQAPRFVLFESIRDFAHEQLAQPQGAQTRHTLHFASFGEPDVLDGIQRGVRSFHTLAREHDNLRAAFHHALHATPNTHLDDALAQTGVALGTIALRTGPYTPTRHLLEQAHQHPRSSRLWRGRLAMVLADLCADANDFDPAQTYYTEASEHAQASGDVTTYTLSLKSLGALRFFLGEAEEARQLLERGLERARQEGLWSIEARFRRELGVWHHNQGDVDEALRHYEAALSIARRIGHREIECWCLNDIGVVHHVRSNLDAARHAYEASLALALELGLRLLEARFCNDIAAIYQVQGDLDAAQQWREKGLFIVRHLGDRATESKCLHELGYIHQSRGDLTRAQSHYTVAAELAARIRYASIEARALNQLGALATLRGQWSLAHKHLDACWALCSTTGDRATRTRCLINRAILAMEQHQPETAETHLKSALELSQSAGYRRFEARCLKEMARLDQALGQHAKALPKLETAMAFATDVKDLKFQGEISLEHAQCALHNQDMEAARTWIQRAEQHARHSGEHALIAHVLCIRATIEPNPDARDEAAALIEHLDIRPPAPLARLLKSVSI